MGIFNILMANKTLAIIILSAMLNPICSARGITAREKTQDSQKPLLTVQEVSYILSTRRGELVDPPNKISPCARAIISCCNGKVINSNCSETMKCGAFFFDDNPCEDKFMIDALKAAKVFYAQFSDVES